MTDTNPAAKEITVPNQTKDTVLNRTMKRIDGTDQNLNDFLGEVLLVVNVASRCGNTPQYTGLQALYDKYHQQGFEVLGFPANDFKEQEPGSDEEIAEFCTTNYGVTFPMFSKISVKGEGMHPLYEEITTQPEPIGGDVIWNFQKYLVNRDGKVIAKFDRKVQPDDPALVEAIESELGAQ
jgi:glutathione peroxidase